MKENGLFSVVILSYRNERYLRCAIDSVLGQSYPAIEVIIADDHSPEFDLPGIETYVNARKGPNVRQVLVKQNPENLGTVKSINRALAQTSGQYIKLLAADDALYDGEVLSKARQALDASRDGIITGSVMRCGPDMKPCALLRDDFARALPQRAPEEIYRRLCIHNGIVGAGVFFTRAFWDRFGPFDERYRLLEDWPTWLRVSREGAHIDYAGFTAANYRGNVGAATSVNTDYLADRKRAFVIEIEPYRKELGAALYLRARLTLRLRNSVLLRKLYGWMFRR